MGLGRCVGTSFRGGHRQRRRIARLRASGRHPLDRTTSMLAAAFAAFDGAVALHFAAIIGFFVSGTVLSGYLIQDSTL